jgi:hypothetical protein
MFDYLSHCLKRTLITGLLACIGHLAYAAPDLPPLNGIKRFAFKVGERGPGGGFIFFVDYFDQYPGFTYLEAAPTDASFNEWCNDRTTSIPGAAGWDANAVGRGRANTNAMLAVCSSGAARDADNYTTDSTVAGDWFLPSESEAMLMYTNLRQAGVGGSADDSVDGFDDGLYWSSTESGRFSAWCLFFNGGSVLSFFKATTLRVRPVRAF